MIDGLGRNFGKGTRLTVLFLGREGEEGKRPHNLVWAGIVTLGLGRIEKKRKKREKKTLQEQKKKGAWRRGGITLYDCMEYSVCMR